MFSNSKSLCKISKSAMRVSERFSGMYVHVMTKKFRKPTLVFGGWDHQRRSNNGWKTFCVYKDGNEIEFNKKVWLGE